MSEEQGNEQGVKATETPASQEPGEQCRAFGADAPSLCKELDWYETMPSACVPCWESRIHELLSGVAHPRDDSPFLRNKSVVEIFQEAFPWYAIPLCLLVLFLVGAIMEPPPPGSAPVSIGIMGNAFIMRLVIASCLMVVLLDVTSLFYYSHSPNMTEGATDAYYTKLPATTTTDAFVRSSVGRISGWKHENSGHRDLYIGGILVVIVCLIIGKGAGAGSGLDQALLVFMFGVLLVFLWEHVAVAGRLWLSDVAILLGIALLANVMALGYYAYRQTGKSVLREHGTATPGCRRTSFPSVLQESGTGLAYLH